MYKGHMQQARQIIQSASSMNNNQPHEDQELRLDIQQQNTNKICAAIHYIKPSKEGTTYVNLTGKYPIQSLYGNNYIIIIYHYNANAI